MFDRACALLESALVRDERSWLASQGDSLPDFRDALRTNFRQTDAGYAALDGVISQLDMRTRSEGFHVLNDWDGQAGRMNPQTIAVDVAAFAAERRGAEPGHERAAAIILDYHYLNVLALLSLRVWDDGDPDANLDRLDRLLALLQDGGGSGHRFASRAATLLLIATAHYEPDEAGYDALLENVRALDRRHRLSVAIDHASAMGCHLRFGFEASYGRDVGAMRADNVADYPWLQFALSTLLEAYASQPDDLVAEALVNGLTPDPGRFIADLPSDRAALLDAFERFRPDEKRYSPLALFFNFSHNVVKGLVVDAVLRARPWAVSLNDLLTSADPSPIKIDAAATLMEHARRNPSRIRGRLTPAIVYDPATGRQAFGATMRRLRE